MALELVAFCATAKKEPKDFEVRQAKGVSVSLPIFHNLEWSLQP